MAVYNRSGEPLTDVFNRSGTALDFAYDISGNAIYQREEPTSIPLRVMSYNVGQWYYGGGDNVPASQDAEYYALQNGMIQNADADIACFCEYWNNMSKVPRTAQSMLSQYYQYIFTQGGGSGYYGRAICSKYLAENWAHHSYTNETNRYYDSVTVTVDNVPITVVVTHLATDSKRFVQIGELIQYLSTLDRFICCGDFNTLYFNKSNVEGETTESTQDYTDIVTPLLNAGFHLANWSTFGYKFTYSDEPTSTWTGCLDNIVTSSNIIIDSVYVDTTKLSDNLTERCDHMPIIADLIVLIE